jgi:hypothetical protein
MSSSKLRNEGGPGGNPPPQPTAAERHQPLPEQTPKAREDDPQSTSRLESIPASPSYRRAVEDPDFCVALTFAAPALRLTISSLT